MTVTLFHDSRAHVFSVETLNYRMDEDNDHARPDVTNVAYIMSPDYPRLYSASSKYECIVDLAEFSTVTITALDFHLEGTQLNK